MLTLPANMTRHKHVVLPSIAAHSLLYSSYNPLGQPPLFRILHSNPRNTPRTSSRQTQSTRLQFCRFAADKVVNSFACCGEFDWFEFKLTSVLK